MLGFAPLGTVPFAGLPVTQPAIFANAGVFALGGQAAGFATRLVCAPASIAVAGGTAQMAMPVNAGAFVLGGQAAGFATRLVCAPASFAVAGGTAQMAMPVGAGAFALGGQAAGFLVAAGAGAGAFALSGQPAALRTGVAIVGGRGDFVLTGQPIRFVDRRPVASGGFVLSGQAAILSLLEPLPAGTGAFAFAAQDIALHSALSARGGTLTLLGWTIADFIGPQPPYIYLVEIEGHDGAAVRTYYFGSTAYTSLPDDVPPNQLFDPRVIDPGNFERHLFAGGPRLDAGGTTGGTASVGVGDIRLASADPGNGETLDHLLDVAVGDRPVAIRALPANTRRYANAITLFRGRAERIDAGRPLEAFDLKLRDNLRDLDRPLLSARFAGTTTEGGGGAEGNADLKGQIKQKAWGKVYNIPCQPANVYDLIYLVSDGAVESVVAYDGGVALINDGDEPNLSALAAATIVPGHYRTCLALGLFRLSADAAPSFGLTADVVEGATAADRTAAQIARRMALHLGIAADMLPAASFAALDAKNDAECGYLVRDETHALVAIQDVLGSIGGWINQRRDGPFQVGRFEAPGSPLIELDLEAQSIGDSLERVSASDPQGSAPVWRVTVDYARVWQPQDEAALAGIVSMDTERAAFLAAEWRSVVAEDASVAAQHLDAREIRVRTYLVDADDAAAEAARLLALHKVKRAMYRLPVPVSEALGVDLGGAVRLWHPRLGLSGGKPFNVVSIADEYARERLMIEVWG